MADLIDYIVENYIVFLIILLVIVMVIIGYIADKTDFWHKKKTTKKEEPTESEGPTKEELEKLKNIKLGDAANPNGPKEDTNVISEPNNIMNNNINEDLNVPFGSPISSKSLETQPSMVSNPTPMANINEDLNAPFGDQKASTPTATVEEDLNVPFGDMPTLPKSEDLFATPDTIKEPDVLEEMPATEEVKPVSDNLTVDKTINTMEDFSIPVPDITPVTDNTQSEANQSNDILDNKVMDDMFSKDELEPVIVPDSYEPNFDAISDIPGENYEVEANTPDINGYSEPIVPEIIVEEMANQEEQSSVLDVNTTSYELDNSSTKEEDIWKF